MTKRKVSQKVQQATEKYLASLKSSREQLTDKQWEVLINHIKCQQIFKWAIPFFLLPLAVFHTCLTIWSFHRTNELIKLVVPDEVVYVSRASDQTPTSLEPDRIKTYLQRLKKFSFHSAVGLINATLLFMVVILRVVYKKHRLKIIEAVIERKEEPKVTSQENPLTLQ